MTGLNEQLTQTPQQDHQVLYTFEYFNFNRQRIKRPIIKQPDGYFDVLANRLMPYSSTMPGAHGKTTWLVFVANAIINYPGIYIYKNGLGDIQRMVYPEIVDEYHADDENTKLAIQWFNPREFKLITRDYVRLSSGLWLSTFLQSAWPGDEILTWMTWALMNLPDCNIRGFP